MKVEAPQAVDSKLLDHWFAQGSAVDAFTELLLNREDLEAHICDGRIYIGYRDEKTAECVVIAGAWGLQPDADTWRVAARSGENIPRQRQ